MQGQAKQLEALAAGTTEYQKVRACLPACCGGSSWVWVGIPLLHGCPCSLLFRDLQSATLTAHPRLPCRLVCLDLLQAQAKQLEALMAGTTEYQKVRACLPACCWGSCRVWVGLTLLHGVVAACCQPALRLHIHSSPAAWSALS